MIIDSLNSADRYISLHRGFRRAFEFLAIASERDPGTVELDGRNMYATISTQPGKTRAEAFLESHRKYIDIHCCLDGEEHIGWRMVEDCDSERDPYDGEKDIMTYSDAPSAWMHLRPGAFVIFFPEDAHAPLVSTGLVKKVVVKILR